MSCTVPLHSSPLLYPTFPLMNDPLFCFRNRSVSVCLISKVARRVFQLTLDLSGVLAQLSYLLSTTFHHRSLNSKMQSINKFIFGPTQEGENPREAETTRGVSRPEHLGSRRGGSNNYWRSQFKLPEVSGLVLLTFYYTLFFHPTALLMFWTS